MSKQKNLKLGWSALLVGVLLVGCAQTNQAPVETRTGFGRTTTVDPATLPGAENAGKPGYYTVKPGDTLIRIGLEHGQSWKDIARWSNLENPNAIEVGQVVRVVPPGAAPDEGRPSTPPTTTTASSSPVQGTALPPAGATSTPAPPPAPAAAPSADAAGLGLIWPASGTVIGTFNETTNKGVDIAGKAGDPVVAAAAGKVIYVGEVRGYGQLIIIQHSKDYLTAYGHNQKLLVKDDQNVKKGQNIAEMGSTDTDRVKLHFELRRQGKPIDPLRYLPKR